MRDPEVAATGRPTIRFTGLSGTFRAPRRDYRKACLKGRSSQTAFARSAQAVRCIAARSPAAGPLHHYTFEVYALDTKIDMRPAPTRGKLVVISSKRWMVM